MPELAAYRTRAWDEAVDRTGEVRPAYRAVIEALTRADLRGARERLERLLERRGVEFIAGGGREIFYLDVVPRIVAPEEWAELAAGLRQRAAALNAFVRDAYEERRMVAAGRIPARVLDSAYYFEQRLAGQPLPSQPAPVIGFDLVRGADGRLAVLEDNARTPSGLAYAVAARDALSQLGLPLDPPALIDPAGAFDLLGQALRDARPAAEAVILLSDGSSNAAWFEHRELARQLDLPLLTRADVRRDGVRLFARVDGHEREVTVVYRRTDQDRLFDEQGNPTDLGELLAGPILDGGLVVCSAFGTGVADDKLAHAYVEEMIRFYLAEEPLLPSVRSYDLGDEQTRDALLDRVGELVIKPRSGMGGHGVVVGPHANPVDVERITAAIRRRPHDFIAQETIELSTHPTFAGGEIEPRHIDLRAYTIGGELAPAPLTRFAREPGALVVNSSEGGGAKDTWVLR